MKASGKSINFGSVFMKVIACLIAVAFLFSGFSNDLVRAQSNDNLPLLSGSGEGGGHSPDHFISKIANTEIPLSMGYIRDVYVADQNKPFVIYLQDAHCNYSCQQSIASIIDYFSDEFGIDHAIVEGGQGNYDFSLFTSIPDLERRKTIVDYFVREGRVTGTEQFAIMHPDRLQVKGLEEQDLYSKNLNVYRESLLYKDEVDKHINTVAHYFSNLKRHMFSKEVNEFDEKTGDYNGDKIPLKDYVNYIDNVAVKKNIDLKEFENLNEMLILLNGEREIKFDVAQEQRDEVIDLLMKKLSKFEVSILVQKSINYKNDDMTPAQFYAYLFSKISSCRLSSQDYPELVKYKRYLDKYDSLEKDVFFDEIFDIQRYIADNIVLNIDAQNLFEMSEDLAMLKKMFDVSITRKQYDYLINNSDNKNAGSYVKFIEQKSPYYKLNPNIDPDVLQIDEYRDRIDNFYKYSFERDKAFIKNIEKYSKGQKAVFVVTGGFHTQNMKELLKKEGYSFMIITPKLEQEGYNPYFKLLGGGLSPIETLLTSAGTSLIALRSIFSSMGLRADRIQTAEGIDSLNALLDSAEAGNDFTVLQFVGDDNVPVYVKLTFDDSVKDEAKEIGTILNKPIYAVILDPAQTEQFITSEETAILVSRNSIADISTVKHILVQLKLIKEEAKRQLTDSKTGLSETEKVRNVLKEQVNANFKKNGKRIWRKFNKKDIMHITNYNISAFVEGLLPVVLSGDYIGEKSYRIKTNCAVEFVLKEMLSNAVGAILSMYDENVYPIGAEESYEPMIAISMDVDENDNFVIYVADNGMGQFAADTSVKRASQEEGASGIKYLDGGGIAKELINDLAVNSEGKFEILMKNRRKTDVEDGATIAKFSVPISKMKTESEQEAEHDSTRIQKLEEITEIGADILPGIEGVDVSKGGIVVSPDQTKDWMSYATYNAGVIELDGNTFIFFRAHNKKDRKSRTGLAVIRTDGDRTIFSDGPLIEPNDTFEKSGLEDLRVTRIDVDGVDTFVFVGAAYDGDMARSVIFSISVDDFRANFNNKVPFENWQGWSKHYLPFGDNYGKDGTLFPEKIKINGKEKYAMLYRGHSFTKRDEIRLAVSDSIDPEQANWESVGTVFSGKYIWENFGIGTGPAPIKTDYGWVVIYHAVDGYLLNGNERHNYTAAIVVLDLEDPMKVLYRSELPFMGPDQEYEKKGFVSNVVFPTGTVVQENKDGVLALELYYGAADDLTGIANIEIDVKQLLENAKDQDLIAEDEGEPTILEDFDAYAELQQEAIAQTTNVLRPETQLQIVVEANDSIFWGANKDNISSKFEQFMKKDMKGLTASQGGVKLLISNSRAQTKEIVSKYDKASAEFSMVVFRLDEFGDVTQEFRQMLKGHKVPLMALNLKTPTAKKGSDKSIIDPFALLHLAINLDALNREVIDEKADEMVVSNTKRNIMILKAAMELGPVMAFPEGIDVLYNGALNVLLPRITDLDISGNLTNWYRALRKVEASA